MTILAERPVTSPDMSGLEILDRAAVGQLIGVSESTVTRYVNASQPGGRYEGSPFPAPAGRWGDRPYWRQDQADDIRAWHAARPGRGAGGGRPRRVNPS